MARESWIKCQPEATTIDDEKHRPSPSIVVARELVCELAIATRPVSPLHNAATRQTWGTNCSPSTQRRIYPFYVRSSKGMLRRGSVISVQACPFIEAPALFFLGSADGSSAVKYRPHFKQNPVNLNYSLSENTTIKSTIKNRFIRLVPSPYKLIIFRKYPYNAIYREIQNFQTGISTIRNLGS